MSMQQKVGGLVAAGSMAIYGTAANAAIDVSAATTTVTNDGGTAIGDVGLAIIGLAAISMVYRWVKASFF